ncbi:MAG: hypothetical protein J0M00_18990 [Burkholderiales bacterium]|nr:hypothetical protein [Burkholderiales bacterium]
MPVKKPTGRPRFAEAAPRGRMATAATRPPPVPPDTEAGDADTRPLSLWPASTRPADLHSSSFGASHFDPLVEQRARERTRAGVALDVCSGMTVLRLVLAAATSPPLLLVQQQLATLRSRSCTPSSSPACCHACTGVLVLPAAALARLLAPDALHALRAILWVCSR